jgi:hypothetical protein
MDKHGPADKTLAIVFETDVANKRRMLLPCLAWTTRFADRFQQSLAGASECSEPLGGSGGWFTVLFWGPAAGPPRHASVPSYGRAG